jgi:hypothetical protein
MAWRDPTVAERATIDEVNALVAAAAVDGHAPAVGGHLRVVADSGATRDLLLGARTAIDGPVAVLDWRTAPLAEVFFRYAPGEAYEVELEERAIAGRVAARARLEVAGGRLVAITTDEVELRRDDGGAWRAHAVAPPALPPARPAETARAILLDADQQRAVDLAGTRSLVVDGEAGVGKTLVALYRIAALSRAAAAARRRFRPLVLVPTEGLRRLVRVLADRLAIPRLEIALVDAWLIDRARAVFPGLPARASEDATAGVIALKRHPAVRAEIARMAGWKRPRADEKLARVRAVLHDLFGDKERLDRIAAAAAAGPGGPLPPRAIAEVLAHTSVQYTATTEQAHADVDADRLVALDGRPLDEGTPLDARGTFDAEDVPVLFELARQGVIKPRADAAPRRYDHIVVDEGQLRSPLELAAIGDALAPDGSVTLAGDHRQDTDDTAWFAGWDAALAELGRTDAERITLSIGYRSVPAITAFARALADAAPAVLPAAPTDAIAAARTAGELHQVVVLGRALEALTARDPWRTVAVIARNDDHARRLARELGRAIDVGLVLDGAFTFLPGVVVTTAAQVAGLEFDAIVVPDLAPGFWPATPEIGRALYVAVTRARDWLVLATPAAWSPLVAAP